MKGAWAPNMTSLQSGKELRSQRLERESLPIYVACDKETYTQGLKWIKREYAVPERSAKKFNGKVSATS